MFTNRRLVAHVAVIDAHVIPACCDRGVCELGGGTNVAGERAHRCFRKAIGELEKLHDKPGGVKGRFGGTFERTLEHAPARGAFSFGALGLGLRRHDGGVRALVTLPRALQSGAQTVGSRHEPLQWNRSNPANHRNDCGSDFPRERSCAASAGDGIFRGKAIQICGESFHAPGVGG